jgi:FMN reductase
VDAISHQDTSGATSALRFGPVSETTVAVVVGNPQRGSRTTRAATLVGERLASLVDGETAVIEVADLGVALLEWGNPTVTSAKETVLGARAIVVASPTYKASFTGLVKSFLDQFDAGALGGAPTIPMMTGGSAAHTLAVEHHLRPVLIEIGASCPTPGLFLFGEQQDDPEPVLDEWFEAQRGVLSRSLGV